MTNKGAFIRYKGVGGGVDLGEPAITTFIAVEHPKIPPMAYGSSLYNLMS
jgi:hypothetical protein